jgi:hypothetical protein
MAHKKLTAREIAWFAALDDAALERKFNDIGTHASHRVKRTGALKLSWIKFSDVMLAEMRRRRALTCWIETASDMSLVMSPRGIVSCGTEQECREHLRRELQGWI